MCLCIFFKGSAVNSAFFGQGTGSIVLNNVQCTRSEARLIDCLSGQVISCSHSQDAGVRCIEMTGKI